MMNVGIIFYAAEQTKDQALWQIATEHCLTTRRFLVRGDGSTSHEGLFNLANRRIPPADHPSGLAQRFELGTGSSVGPVWFHHRLSVHP